ncbi:MAG: hypothetical protein IKU30_04795 [Clostridia bacterium]|nr:hypothetical protein [Clostridia bacterium]
MNIINDAKIIKNAIEQICLDVIDKSTADCFRLKKAKVVSAPNGSTCSVRLVGDTTVIDLPYSSRTSTVAVGDIVWVGVIGNNMASAIVYEKQNFN